MIPCVLFTVPTANEPLLFVNARLPTFAARMPTVLVPAVNVSLVPEPPSNNRLVALRAPPELSVTLEDEPGVKTIVPPVALSVLLIAMLPLAVNVSVPLLVLVMPCAIVMPPPVEIRLTLPVALVPLTGVERLCVPVAMLPALV